MHTAVLPLPITIEPIPTIPLEKLYSFNLYYLYCTFYTSFFLSSCSTQRLNIYGYMYLKQNAKNVRRRNKNTYLTRIYSNIIL